jgi:phosphoenolpyruvate carboxykinase (ATP)
MHAVHAAKSRCGTQQRMPRVPLMCVGWCGGSAGVGGRRIALAHTRSIIAAIHSGELAAAACVETPVFRLQVGAHVPVALQLVVEWLAAVV